MKTSENQNIIRKEVLLKLTKKELEITKLIAKGFTSKEIAIKLQIGFETVKTHRKKIFRKLGIKNMAELVNYANHYGLLK